jgi:hypothetical protein
MVTNPAPLFLADGTAYIYYRGTTGRGQCFSLCTAAGFSLITVHSDSTGSF